MPKCPYYLGVHILKAGFQIKSHRHVLSMKRPNLKAHIFTATKHFNGTLAVTSFPVIVILVVTVTATATNKIT